MNAYFVIRNENYFRTFKFVHKTIDKDDEVDKNDNFQPIIDFPNFLLIVLKITRLRNKDDFNPLSFTLDDKELIKEFEKVNLTPKFVKDFAYNLLLAKYFLDNYVIHHAMVKIGLLRIHGNCNIIIRRVIGLPTLRICTMIIKYNKTK